MLIFETDSKPFGQNGISWFAPFFIVIWKHSLERSRVIQNELVHVEQWKECAALATLLTTPLVLSGILPLLGALTLIWASFLGTYLAVYAYGRAIMGRTRREGYLSHPMEIDSRTWDDGNLKNRPRFAWLRYFA